jgi:hypothetical protein
LSQWHYHDVYLELSPTLTYDGQQYDVPTYGGEGWQHVLTKVAIAAHLLVWGYPWGKIHWEKLPPESCIKRRPDIYTETHGELPAFWFECRGTDNLEEIVAAFQHWRIVQVIDVEWFLRWWNGKGLTITDNGKEVDIWQIKDVKRRKQVVVQRREALVPGTELWAVGSISASSNRILYAVRREKDGVLTYLETGEGWALSGLRYISKRRDRFEPLL